MNRRKFMKDSMLAGAGMALSVPYAQAFSRSMSPNDVVNIGVIGTGDEGSVLMGAHTPDYAQIVAIADIRPYNVHPVGPNSFGPNEEPKIM